MFKNSPRNLSGWICLTASLILSVHSTFGETAQEAWKALCPGWSGPGSYEYVENNPALPNVLLYGDSISVHYTPYVRKDLEGRANVYRLYCNGTTSGSFIEKVTNMQDVMRNKDLENPWTFQWDVIHFNVGLHDIKYMTKDKKMDVATGKLMTSPEQYEKNLIDIIAYLKKTAPGATLIFATTTPVPENSAGRVPGDEIRYNEIALKVLKNYPEILIDDLYTFTLPHRQEWWIEPGNVHYNDKGQAEQASQVATVISKALSIRQTK